MLNGFDLIMTACVFQMLDIYLESKKFQLPDDVTLETMCVKYEPFIALSIKVGWSHIVFMPRDFPTFSSRGQWPVEFGKISFEPSKLGILMQSKRTGLPF